VKNHLIAPLAAEMGMDLGIGDRASDGKGQVEQGCSVLLS